MFTDEEVAALVVDNGEGVPSFSNDRPRYARVAKDGIVKEVSTTKREPFEEWKICKSTTAVGKPY